MISTGQGLLSYNMYIYCLNNPINLSDPNGMFSISAFINIIKDTIKKIAGNILKASKRVPTKGEPNSTIKKPNGDLREYGPDGRATKDTDYSHPHHHPELPNPHAHDWDWSTGEPKRGPAYNPNKIVSGALGVGVSIGAGYLVYRGIRMLPSLLPTLWWTIPANVTIP